MTAGALCFRHLCSTIHLLHFVLFAVLPAKRHFVAMLSRPIFVLELVLHFVLGVQAGPASRPTAASGHEGLSGDHPQPTAPPDVSLIDFSSAELKERQYYGDVCGYASGDIRKFASQLRC